MGLIIVFLLAVLFVAAVWGRESAQKLFKGGVKVAGVLLLLGGIAVIVLAINLQAPSQSEINRTLQSDSHSAYHVPLDEGNPNDAAAPLPRPVTTEPASGGGIPPNLIATDNYLAGRSTAPATQPEMQSGQPAPAIYTVRPPVPAGLPTQKGKPHFGFSYEPVNGFVVVTHVYPGSPAAAAGLQPGMGILGVDGQAVHQVDDVWVAQYKHHGIGDIVPFTVGDTIGPHNINIRLGSDAEPWGASVQ